MSKITIWLQSDDGEVLDEFIVTEEGDDNREARVRLADKVRDVVGFKLEIEETE